MSPDVLFCSSGATIYHRVSQISSGYAILAPGYKFRGRQFEKPGYTRTVWGRRGLSYVHCPMRVLVMYIGYIGEQSFVLGEYQ